jgi:hypothetical protein
MILQRPSYLASFLYLFTEGGGGVSDSLDLRDLDNTRQVRFILSPLHAQQSSGCSFIYFEHAARFKLALNQTQQKMQKDFISLWKSL